MCLIPPPRPEYWVLSLSGGKDSTALGLEWLKRHQKDPVTYPLHEAVYCDITVKEELYDESGIVITKVKYPADVKMGVVNLMKWELENREKVGVASETISRHSVTYFSMDGDNSTMGYPKSLMGFLRPYMKARFGQGGRR